MEKKYSSNIIDEAYNEIKDIIEEKRRGQTAFRKVFKFKKNYKIKGLWIN